MASISLLRLHNSLPFHQRLRLAFGMLALLVLALTVAALIGIEYVQSKTRLALQIDLRLSQLANNVATKVQIARRYDQSYFLYFEDPQQRDEFVQLWSIAVLDLDRAITTFAEAVSTETDQRQAHLWRTSFNFYYQGFQRITQAVREGEIQDSQEAVRRFTVYQPNIQFLSDLSLKVAYSKAAQAEQAGLEVERSANIVRTVFKLLGAAAVLLALVSSLILPYGLTRPIARLNQAVQSLSEGDLSARTGLDGADEFGRLGRAFDHMAATIAQRTAELRTQFSIAEEARSEAEAARAQATRQLETITAQQEIIRAMSIPVLPVSDHVLVMPLIGALDSERLAQAQERALQALEGKHASHLILDVTGVPVVDTQVAGGIIRIAQAAGLLGARAILVGIRPDVAQAIVGLGLDLSSITTYASLQSGIRATLPSGATAPPTGRSAPAR
ncbi:MAG: STAS domain-containing protein [Chloroflexaceae bacterium]